MNEGPQQSSNAGTSGPLGGERLAAARRAHEISANDIAKELHLDEMKVRALEKNDFAVLGAPVFAKGHLRKYAELVGVPVDDVLADYYELNRSAGAPPVVRPVRKVPREIAWGRWIAATVIVLLVIGGVYWFITRGPQLSLTQAMPPALVSRVPLERPAASAADLSRSPGDAGLAASTDTLETDAGRDPGLAALATPTEDPVPATLSPRVNVELVYSGDCWTEVTDAAGRSLFYDLGKEGRVVSLAGEGPLDIILGASDNVSIAVEGRDYPIPDSARRGRMARLTIHSR